MSSETRQKGICPLSAGLCNIVHACSLLPVTSSAAQVGDRSVTYIYQGRVYNSYYIDVHDYVLSECGSNKLLMSSLFVAAAGEKFLDLPTGTSIWYSSRRSHASVSQLLIFLFCFCFRFSGCWVLTCVGMAPNSIAHDVTNYIPVEFVTCWKLWIYSYMALELYPGDL